MKLEDKSKQFKNIAGTTVLGAAGAAMALRRGRATKAASSFSDQFDFSRPFKALSGAALGVASWQFAQAALRSCEPVLHSSENQSDTASMPTTHRPWGAALTSAGIVGGATLTGCVMGGALAGAEPHASGIAAGFSGLHRLPKAFVGGAAGLALASGYLATYRSENTNKTTVSETE